MNEKGFYWVEQWWNEAMPNLERRPSALLLWGPRGIGKTDFALDLLTGLLCHSSVATRMRPCGRCASCSWMKVRQHPDFRWIRPDADADAAAEAAADRPDMPESAPDAESSTATDTKTGSRDIRIDQIRGLSAFAHVGSHRGGLRVVLVSPAQKMNYAASNALLKLLEEPPPGLMFLLVADTLRGIPATILSRCRRQELSVPGAELPRLQNQNSEAYSWLMPLLSAPSVDPLGWAERAGKSPMSDALDIMMRWMVDVDRCRLGLQPRSFPDAADTLREMSLRVRSAQAWVQTLAEIQRLRAFADHPLNPRLAYEGLFDRYRRAFS